MLIISSNFKKLLKHLHNVPTASFQSTLTGTPNLPLNFSVVGTTTPSGSFSTAGIRYFQKIGHTPGDFTGSEGWSQPFAESLHTGTVTWQNDVMAPFSSSNVMTVTLASGTYVGTPDRWFGEIDFQTSSQKNSIYYVMLFKLNSNFQGHNSGMSEISYIWSNAKSSSLSIGGQIVMEPYGSPNSNTGSLFPRLLLQGGTADFRDTGSGWITNNGFLPQINSTYQLSRSVWIRWEVFAQMNTYNQSSNTYNNDGIIQSWITTEGEIVPTQIHNLTDVTFDTFNSGSALFVELQSLYQYGGTGTSSLFADNQIEYSRCEIYTGTATTGSQFITTFNTASSPHAGWAQFGYTDFRTQYVPGGNTNPTTGQALQEETFLAQHFDSIMSGPRIDLYASTSLYQIPYTLCNLIGKLYDNAYNLYNAAWRDADSWSAANGRNPEDMWLHIASGSPSWKYPIQFVSSSGMVQITYTDPYAFISESVVYVSGTKNVNLDGTHSISNYSYSPTTASSGLGYAQIRFFLDTIGFSAVTGYVQPPPGDGTKTPMNRLIGFVNPSFPPPYYILNPGTSSSLDYTSNRYNRIMSASYGGYADGVFMDGMAPFAGAPSVEYPTIHQYYIDTGNMLTYLRNIVSGSKANGKFLIRPNIANYLDSNSAIIISGALSCHMEETNDPRHVFWFGAGDRGYIRNAMFAGVLVELVNSYAWSDAPSGGGGNYANDFIPVGAASASSVRQKIVEYAAYLSCLTPSCSNGLLSGSTGGIICSIWNNSWHPLNSITGSAIYRWLPLFEYPIGKQVNDLNIIISGKVDPKNQTVVIRQIDFTSASIFIRGVDDYITKDFTDSASFAFPLPVSSGSTGGWKRIQTDGFISASLMVSANLRPAEAIFLVGA